ncbi:MAG: hypothetical protein FJ276_22150 [Planctomycetes bacterium]|nr:hypothetical protein [Planctomycetota bacterium]
MKSNRSRAWVHAVLCGLGLAAAVSATGCQVSVSGQTLPSPWYTTDDVQYFPPAAEFKLSQEAAMMKAYNAEQQAQAR